MTFQPIIPTGGNLGWQFLSRTLESQQAAFAQSPEIDRAVSHFRDEIGSITTAQELVEDRQLLQVALGAFGLEDDIDNRFFLRRVLEDGVLAPEAFANRLSDRRYLALAEAFRFDLSPPNTVISTFADDIIDRFRQGTFEVAVGAQDENLRLALNAEREVNALLDRGLSEEATWFSILGSPPLRRVFENALGLPPQIAGTDIDSQLEVFRSKAANALGIEEVTDLREKEVQDTLIRRFLLRAELDAGPQTLPGQVALSLLQTFPTA